MGGARFSAERYELCLGEERLTLVPFPAEEADALATAVAAIDPWATYGYPAASIASYLAGDDRSGVRLLLQVDGESAGVVALQPDWLHGPYLRVLAILPPFQGRGIGSAILDWIESEARNANERNLWVVASQINAGAIRFYQRHGFAQAAQLDDLAYDDRIEILMRKRLIASA